MSARRSRSSARTASKPLPAVVRLDRVLEARRRVAEGWYDRPEVRDRLVEALMEEVGAR
ncbi:MAG: hypothetical protein RL721_1659 [Candidatus Eisenbacteria bacterium]|jgi:hypothetical protein